MTIRIFVAPAGAGKTAYAVAEARREARGLRATPHVLVASALQAQAFRRRLALAGGAIGVRVLTFERLYHLCLSATDAVYTQISDPVQHRVIRSVVRELLLVHYGPLVDRPGFVQVLRQVIGELKAARVEPEFFTAAVAARGDVPRLRELAEIYAAYQERLQAEGWADAAGMAWLTAEALEDTECPLGRDWPLFLVDGFDDFTPVQLAVLAPLASRVERMVVTLTGTLEGAGRPLVHRRFQRTRRELEEVLGVEAGPLPVELAGLSRSAKRDRSVLGHLEDGLFRSDARPMPGDGTVDLIEAPHRVEEVRAALRWLKGEVVERAVRPSQLALLARDVGPYRPFIREVAAEFGLPIHFHSGRPLNENPAAVALMDLLRLMLPRQDVATTGGEGSGAPAGGEGGPGPRLRLARLDAEPVLPPRLVVEAWRSPYFDWSAGGLGDHVDPRADAVGNEPVGIEPGDADLLGMVVRRGRVIGGLAQWEAAFQALKGAVELGSTREARVTRPAAEALPGVEVDAEEGEAPSRALTPERVRVLHGKFERFVRRLTPPVGHHRARDFVRWLETLIGPDPELASSRRERPREERGLDVVARVREAEGAVVERDVAALRCLKEVLRGMVWAEEALNSPAITFSTFFAELVGAIEAAVYQVPRSADGEEILVATVVDVRGVPFRSLAVLGLAEGFFPRGQSEDPLLHDADRVALSLPLQPSTRSAEAEYFYETVAAPRERLLLTRPRLTQDGAPWEPSPYWEEVLRLLDITPAGLTGTSGPLPHEAGSWPELLQAAAAAPEAEDLWAWLRQRSPDSVSALDAAVAVSTWRGEGADSPFDGGLHPLRDHFTATFGRDYPWSASRLEAYRTCPFFFFVGKVLALEPREEPAEGIDAMQRGTLYHDVMERVYRAVEDPVDLEQLLAALPDAAAAVLDEAPERLGFRATAWWAETRREMEEDVRRSLEALHEEELREDFVPIRYEAAFGLGAKPALVVSDPGKDDRFVLRGLIDRVDRDGGGRVRIIDYKTAGPWQYGSGTLRGGEKIQLPLYALAARDALGLGEPVSGFYWHVCHALPSPLKLEDFGPQDAVRVAVVHAWEAIHGAREGRFGPTTPRGGCPSYCPAAAFCWHYRRGYVG